MQGDKLKNEKVILRYRRPCIEDHRSLLPPKGKPLIAVSPRKRSEVTTILEM